MKKKTIVFITILLLLVMPVTLLGWCFLTPAQFDATFMGALKYKCSLLEQTPGKRIILVGGSSAAFGVDSALLEAQFPEYRVVNFGMYAALGTAVMLNLSEPALREGDIVILMPEQQEQTLSDFFDPAVMWQGVDGAWELLLRLDKEQLGRMLGAWPEFAGQKFAYWSAGEMPQPQGVYARASFNAYGDVDSPLCARNTMPGGFDANTPVRFDAAVLSDEFVDRVNAYAAAAEQVGAQVWYGLCPMNALAVTGPETAEDFYDTLIARLQIPVLGDPRDSVMEAGWFYDTNFHLNNSGKRYYTRLLARNLKAMLGDPSPTEIGVPPMPELGETVLWQGDDTQAHCFRYEDRGETAAIVGLTPAGREAAALTVPSTWNGKPVTAIASGAFSEGTALETVTIQQNIRSIGNGAFAGCGRLTRIRLENPVPSDCTVGQDLLEGTAAAVLVPEEALGAYRTDYFWSVYGTRIQPEK